MTRCDRVSMNTHELALADNRRFLASLNLPPSHNASHMLKVQALSDKLFMKEVTPAHQHLRTDNALIAGTHDCSDPKVDHDGSRREAHRQFLIKWCGAKGDHYLSIIKVASFTAETKIRERALLRQAGVDAVVLSSAILIPQRWKELLKEHNITPLKVFEHKVDWATELCGPCGCSPKEVEEHIFLRQLLSEADKFESFDLYRCASYGYEYKEKRNLPITTKTIIQHVFDHCEEKLFYLYPYYFSTMTGSAMAYERAMTMLKQYTELIDMWREITPETEDYIMTELTRRMESANV